MVSCEWGGLGLDNSKILNYEQNKTNKKTNKIIKHKNSINCTAMRHYFSKILQPNQILKFTFTFTLPTPDVSTHINLPFLKLILLDQMTRHFIFFTKISPIPLSSIAFHDVIVTVILYITCSVIDCIH